MINLVLHLIVDKLIKNIAMKKGLFLLFSISFLLMSFNIFQGSKLPVTTNTENGIQFEDITFEEALKQAKKTKKLIFIDAYTEWCGPCKRMAATTFKDKAVGAIFNSKFINLKIEMEKSEMGPEIARRYKVRAYPTLLFIDGDGKEVHRLLGLHTADQFLNEIAHLIK